jgi:NAD(P)-dependent dehydrogenase (short-subunit alcohol dehydrogenase family)
LDVNVLGPVRVTKTFGPLLLRTANHPDVPNKLPKDKTAVVNIGSVAAWGTPWQTPYAALKVRQPQRGLKVYG